MKKLYLLTACLVALATAQAQTVNFSDYAAEKYNWNSDEKPATASYEMDVPYTQINRFRFYNNNDDVCSIAYNKKTVDGTKYFACFKTQGGSKWEDSETPASRVIEVNVTGPCTISGVMASSSKSDDRELYISTAKVDSDYDKEDESYVGCIAIKAADGAKQYTFDYQGEEATLYLYSRTGGINIYTISVTNK